MQSKRIAIWIGAFAALLPLVAASPAAAEEGTTTDASKSGVTFKSGDNNVTLGIWGMVRTTWDDKERYDADTAGTGVGKEDGLSGQFKVHKFRIYAQGTIYKPWLKFKLEAELADSTGASDNKLTDAYVEFAQAPLATVRAGQWKVPFGLQQITPDIRQEFVDRSIADGKFAPGRDQGVGLLGVAGDAKFGYQVAVFNGSGQSAAQEDNGFLYAGRVYYDPFGEYKLSEGAQDNPDKHVLHFGLAYRTGEVAKGTATTGVFEDPNNESAYGLEAAWKYRRFFALAEYYGMTDEQKNPTAAPDIDSKGYHAQFGVFVVPKKVELALRYSQVDPDTETDDDNVAETRIVCGYHWKGHNLKFQFDVGQIHYDAGYGDLSSLARRNLPSLGTRLVEDVAYNDRQYRGQVTFAF
jgi:phosphate-selective porin